MTYHEVAGGLGQCSHGIIRNPNHLHHDLDQIRLGLLLELYLCNMGHYRTLPCNHNHWHSDLNTHLNSLGGIGVVFLELGDLRLEM